MYHTIVKILGDLLFIAGCFVAGNIIYMGFPLLKWNQKLRKRAFMIKKENYSEKQGKIECGGYSAAYVYRHLGKAVHGLEIYKETPCKTSKGHIYCKGIVKLAKKYGFLAAFRTGNLIALKNTIAKGTPVIVMIRTRVKATALHYIPLVGYDEEYFYAVDSMSHLRNAESPYYNRKIPVQEFRKLWNVRMVRKNIIVLTHLFIEIDVKKEM